VTEGQQPQPQARTARPTPPQPPELRWRELPIELELGRVLLDFRRTGVLRLGVAPSPARNRDDPGCVQLTVADDNDQLSTDVSAATARLLALRLLAASDENARYIDAQTGSRSAVGRVWWSDVDALLGGLWTLGEPHPAHPPDASLVDDLEQAFPAAADGPAEPRPIGEPIEVNVEPIEVDLRGGGVGAAVPRAGGAV
jgi:hypothetical protein